MSNPLKKTMVFLGLAEEDLEEPEARASAPKETSAAKDAPASKPAAAKQTPQRAAVTPLRRVTPTRPAATPQAMNEILTVHPTAYQDAKVIAESFREGVPVIINLSRMEESDAKRLIDFSSGLTMGLNGRIERVTSKVFLLSPEHIEASSEDGRREGDGSFFVAPSA